MTNQWLAYHSKRSTAVSRIKHLCAGELAPGDAVNPSVEARLQRPCCRRPRIEYPDAPSRRRTYFANLMALINGPGSCCSEDYEVPGGRNMAEDMLVKVTALPMFIVA